jgi:phosphohistidine phosphatase
MTIAQWPATCVMADCAMDLILWRHCEAEDGGPDLDRRLTPLGRRDAQRMASWLRTRLPADCRIVSSPAQRARETAAALGRAFAIEGDLAPGAVVEDVLRVAQWPDAPASVLVVAHQPTLGETASRLAGATSQPFRKGAVWWLVQDADGGVALRAAVAPGET